MPSSVSAARLAALLPPDDLVDSDVHGQPAYRVLADQIRRLIVDGQVLVGSRLPSERGLTQSLAVSRTTVGSAYAALRESGYLTTRRGSGSVASLPAGNSRRRAGIGLFPAEVTGDVIDLTCAATRAPAGTAGAYEAAVAALPQYLAGAGYLTLGIPELREAIATRYAARGLPTSPEDVLVTSGAVAGMSVAMSAFLRPGDRVLVETPTYPNTVHALRQRGARLSATPVTSRGWDLDHLAAQIARGRPRAALLIPDFHNPTGAVLDDPGRANVAAALRHTGSIALVDETTAELALDDGDPATPFGAFYENTVTIGSAAKSHWGGLRLGWIRAPRTLLDALIEARVTVDLGAPVLEQLVLLELLRESPGLPSGRRSELRESRDALVAALAVHLPQASFELPAGGLSLWVRLPDVDADAVVHRAEHYGLYLAAGTRFAVTGGLDAWVRIPYVAPAAELAQAVHRLARAFDDVGGSTGHTRGETTGRRRPLIA